MKKPAPYLVLLIFLSSNILRSQVREVDSLRKILQQKIHDTTRCNLLDKLIEYQSGGEWPKTNKDLMTIAEPRANCKDTGIVCRTFKKYYVHGLLNLGHDVYLKGETKQATEIFEKALAICEEIKYKNGTATALVHRGSVFGSLGDIPKAIEAYMKALAIYESTKEKLGQAQALNNLGLVYRNLGDYTKALEYYNRSLEIKKVLGEKNGISVSLNNIAMIYYNFGDPDCKGKADSCKMLGIKKALELHLQSLKLREENEDLWGQAISLSNLASLYDTYGDPACNGGHDACMKAGKKMAFEFYLKSLELRKKISDKRGIAQTLASLAAMYNNEGKTDIALKYGLESMKLGQELGFPESIKNAANVLVATYRKTGNYKKALENYEIWLTMRDSLKNVSGRKASIRSQLKYDFDKKAAADSVAHAKEAEITSAKLQQQESEIQAKKNQAYALFGGLGLVAIFAAFMYNRYRLTQLQKNIIEEQKKTVEDQKKIVEEQKYLVELKQREVTDSIIYARRIQKAHLPADHFIEKQIKRLNKKSDS